MKDREREEVIKAFAELYFPSEEGELLRRMPTERIDPQGEMFDEFMNMVQTLSSARQDRSLTPEDRKTLEARMKLVSLKYNYPHRVIIEVGADDNTSG